LRQKSIRACGHEFAGCHLSMTMRDATQTKPRKLAAFFSYRVATRRNCLACAQNLSTTFRSRYKSGSIPVGPVGSPAAG
jgi:hypothetical protein